MAGNQQSAIRALLQTRTVTDAATLAGVSERTLFRWLADSTFRAALATAEGELLDAAQRRLLALQGKAIDVLDVLLTPETDIPHGVQLRAAQAVLDSLLKLRELRDLEERLAALESRLTGGEQ